MVGTRIVAALAVLVALSGCIEGDSAPESAGALAPDSTPQSNATPLDDVAAELAISKDDYVVMNVSATDAGAQAAFRFTIPEGTNVPMWYNEDIRGPVLEMAFRHPAGVDAVHVLMMAGDSGRVYEEFVRATGEVESFPFAGGGFGVGVNEWSTGNGIGSLLVHLPEGKANTEIVVIVGAIGEGELTAGLRFLDQDPVGSPGPWASIDYAEFLSKTTGNGWALDPVGQGEGLRVGYFYDYFRTNTVPSWTRAVAGHIDVADSIPTGPARVATALTASAPSVPAGYASTASLVWTNAHAGQVTNDHAGPGGQEISTTDPIVASPIVASTVALLRGDGDGASHATLSVQMAGAPTVFPQLIFMVNVHADHSVESLTGTAVEDKAQSYSNLPVRATDDGWIRAGSPLHGA